MPFGDGTGPMGQGPMTGRGMGFCAGSSTPGCARPSFGRGRGFRNSYRATGLTGWQRARNYSPNVREEEQGQIKDLQDKIKDLEKRLSEIRKKK